MSGLENWKYDQTICFVPGIGRGELIFGRVVSPWSENIAISVSVWKVAPSTPRSEKSRRLRHSREEVILGRVVSALVWKVAPSPPWSGKSRRQPWSKKSRRLRLGREELLLGRAVSALVWKDAPSPSPSSSRESDYWSRRLHLAWEVAPYLLRSGNSRRLRLGRKKLIFESRIGGKSHRLPLGLEICAVSALIWKFAPSPPWSGKSRRLRLSLESRAVSTLNPEVAWLLPRSRRIDSWTRRLRLGLEIRAVSRRSRNSWNCSFWSRWPGRSRRCFLSRAISWVAPYQPWSRKTRRLHHGRESPERLFLVAPYPCSSGKSRRVHLGLESLEMAEFGLTKIVRSFIKPKLTHFCLSGGV